MPKTLYEEAIETVRSGLNQAVLLRGYDPYEADQMVLTAKCQLVESGAISVFGIAIELDSELTEDEGESRINKHAFELGMWLDHTKGLPDSIIPIVARAIRDELEVLLEEKRSNIISSLRDRQKRVLSRELPCSM